MVATNSKPFCCARHCVTVDEQQVHAIVDTVVDRAVGKGACRESEGRAEQNPLAFGGS
jgi:hypothetical protein